MRMVTGAIASTEILGLSHLVCPVSEFLAAETFLGTLGYSTGGRVESGVNPPAKAAFIDGPLSPTYSMQLMVGPRGTCPVELLKEGDGRALKGEGASDFEAIFSPGELSPDQVIEGPNERANPMCLPGFGAAGAASAASVRCSVVIPSVDIQQTLMFWTAVGLSADQLSPEMARVSVRSAMPGQIATIYIVHRPAARPRGVLNAPGLTCLSLFCLDTDRLTRRLVQEGFEAGTCFDLSPFGRNLRIVFVRSRTGELYELISVAREVR